MSVTRAMSCSLRALPIEHWLSLCDHTPERRGGGGGHGVRSLERACKPGGPEQRCGNACPPQQPDHWVVSTVLSLLGVKFLCAPRLWRTCTQMPLTVSASFICLVYCAKNIYFYSLWGWRGTLRHWPLRVPPNRMISRARRLGSSVPYLFSWLEGPNDEVGTEVFLKKKNEVW